MAFLQAGTPSVSATSRVTSMFTVPTGVTSGQTALIVIEGAATATNEVQVTPTLSRSGGGGTFTLLAPSVGATAAANVFVWVYKATGLVAGDVITVGVSATRIFDVFNLYFDHDFGVIGTFNPRSASTATSVASAITVPTGSKVYALTGDRSASSTRSGTVNSNGDTLTTDYDYDETTGAAVSLYVGEFTEPTTSTGTTTTTYSTANSNGWGLHVAELVTSSAASGTVGFTLAAGGAASPAGPAGSAAFTLASSGTSAGGAAGAVSFTFSTAGSAGAPTLTRVMLGIPDTTAIRATVLTVNTSAVRLAVSSSSSMTSPTYSSSTTPDAQGYCTNLTVTGLTAGGTYWYQVELNGTFVGSPVQVKTLPTPGTPASFSLAFGSCVKVGGGTNASRRAGYSASLNPGSFASIAGRPSITGRTGPDLFLHLGDIAYIWTSATDSRVPDDAALIRAGYESGMDATARALMASSPSGHTPSDNDDPGGNGDAGSGNWPACSNGTVVGVWKQVMSYPPLPDSNAVYRAHQYGRVLLIITDGRTYMDTATNTDNASKSKLGATQKAWFLGLINTAKANGVGQIIWAHEDYWNDKGTTSAPGTTPQQDGWGAYNTERTQLGSAIAACGVPLLGINGDTHTGMLDDGTNNSHGGFPVFCGAPFYQDAQFTTYTNSHGSYPTSGTGNLSNQQQYGWLDIADNGTTITTTCKLWDATSSSGVYTSDVQRASTMTLTATPSAAAAGSIGFSITAAGPANASEAGTASFTVVITGSSAAPSMGQIGMNLTAGGSAASPAAGTVSLNLASSGALSPPVGTGAIGFTFTTASNARANSTGTVNLALNASGVTGGFSPAAGTVSLAFAVAVSPAGTATGQTLFSLAASGTSARPAAGSVPFVLAATGEATGNATPPRDITITVTTGGPRLTVTTGSS